ncbi:indole-3-glycerol phosphate synthase TrpC [Planctomycetota bacterium]
MSDILYKILTAKKKQVAADQQMVPLDSLKNQIAQLPKCRNFYRTITKKNPRGVNVIAEIKRASPSAGLIRSDFDPVRLAQTYQAAGADAISVLTDEPFFQGRLEFLSQVKQAVNLPVLRKDFIIDPYQIYQSRAAGADAVLLIAEVLNPAQLMDSMILANSLTLTVLLEVHQLDSLLQVRSLIGWPQPCYSLLGINNRNLKTMEVDLANSIRLSQFVENKNELVSESGVTERPDVERLIDAGFCGILIGETLMRSSNIEAKFAELFGSAGETDYGE